MYFLGGLFCWWSCLDVLFWPALFLLMMQKGALLWLLLLNVMPPVFASCTTANFYSLLFDLPIWPCSTTHQLQFAAGMPEAKIFDDDVSGAMYLASSNDKLALFDNEKLSGLQAKHPPVPSTSCFPGPPDDSCEALSVSCALITHVICSFKVAGWLCC